VILVDTSVWSRHFRRADGTLVRLLEDRSVLTHAWIVGELALGPGMRLGIVRDLLALPGLPTVPDSELLAFVELHRLRGICWVDAQLLLAAIRAGATLWTLDAALAAEARRFEVGGEPA
jgi:predicted nucleic acid-binding protein